MRWQPSVLILVIVTCISSASQADDVVDPATFIKGWATTFNDNSPEKQSAYYDRSEKTEVIVSSGIRHRGFKAVEKAYQDDQKELKYYDSTASQITARILGETAVVAFEHQFKIQFSADDSRWQIHIRTTSVLRRIDKTWKIALEHSSPIRGVERMTRLKDSQGRPAGQIK